MWLVFLILLDLYLIVKIIRTFLDILDFFEMKKSARKLWPHQNTQDRHRPSK